MKLETASPPPPPKYNARTPPLARPVGEEEMVEPKAKSQKRPPTPSIASVKAKSKSGTRMLYHASIRECRRLQVTLVHECVHHALLAVLYVDRTWPTGAWKYKLRW